MMCPVTLSPMRQPAAAGREYPSVQAIVRDALASATPEIRSQMRWISALWGVMVALQIWDSRDGRGAAGAAEFLSAVLGASGVALLGLAHTLNLTMREAAGAADRWRKGRQSNRCCSPFPLSGLSPVSHSEARRS